MALFIYSAVIRHLARIWQGLGTGNTDMNKALASAEGAHGTCLCVLGVRETGKQATIALRMTSSGWTPGHDTVT